MNLKKYFAVSLVMLLVSLAGCTTGWQSIETRKGVSQRFFSHEPFDQEHIATVLLFMGGKGQLTMQSNNFLIRTINQFVKNGFRAVAVDLPTSSNDVMKFRMSTEHLNDIKKLILHLKKESSKPVWIVGTSMGTISATHLASNLKTQIDGLVLTSSITRSSRDWGLNHCTHPYGILSMNLENVTVPTLIVFHRDDSCTFTPAADAKKIKKALVNSPKTAIICLDGGKDSKAKPCKPKSHHGFYGIEEKAVASISEFIKHGKSTITNSCESGKVNRGSDFTTEIVTFEKDFREYRMLLIEPNKKPIASLVMFRSMGGAVGIGGTNQHPKITRYCQNFPVRTMYNFARKGFRVLLVARPRGIKKKIKWPSYHRMSSEHIEEIKAIVSFVKNKSSQPVWLLGSSRGTLSAVQGSIHIKEINGLALVSPRVGAYEDEIIRFEKPNALLDMDLKKIKIPVILLSHKYDPSGISSCRGSLEIKKRLINSPFVKVECLSGGRPYSEAMVKSWKKRGRHTQPPHRFWGIEGKVVNVVSEFMMSYKDVIN